MNITKKIEKVIKEYLVKKDIKAKECHGNVLINPNSILTKKGLAYKKFSYFKSSLTKKLKI